MKDSRYPAIPDRLKRLGVQDGDWFTACKDGLAWLMRPGMPLKIRIAICLILHSQGYNNELAMMQVQKQARGDASLFVALSPFAIITILQKFAIEEFRRSGIELDDEQRKRLRISGPNMRKALEELEQEDGTITRVRANCEPKRLFGLSFDEALNKSLVTPIENLSQRERKKLNQRSFIYVHTHPRPATKTALMRRVDDELLAPPESKEDKLLRMMDGPKQMAFKLLFGAGVANAKLAAQVAIRVDFQAAYRKTLLGDAMAKEGRQEMQQIVAPIAKAEQMNLPFGDSPTPSAAVNSPAPVTTSSASPSHTAAVDPLLVSQPRQQSKASLPSNQADWDAVGRAAAEYFVVDDRWIQRLVAKCQQRTADVTPAEIAQLVHVKGKQAMGKDSPGGFLLTAVPNLCEGESFRRLRDRMRQADVERQAEAVASADAPRAPEDFSGEWGKVKEALRKRVSPEGYDNWIRDTRQLSRPGASTSPLIEVPDKETLAWLTTEYRKPIAIEMAALGLAAPCYEVRSKPRAEVA